MQNIQLNYFLGQKNLDSIQFNQRELEEEFAAVSVVDQSFFLAFQSRQKFSYPCLGAITTGICIRNYLYLEIYTILKVQNLS